MTDDFKNMSEDERREFWRSAAQTLKECVKDGSAILAPGNKILWTAEELAAMTPEQRKRCEPKD